MSTLRIWWNNLSNRVRTSFVTATTLLAIVSTFLSIIGISFEDLIGSSIWVRVGAVFVLYFILWTFCYIAIGLFYRNSITIDINTTKVTLKCGDIFKEDAYRVIPCDSTFSTQVDDKVISKKSVHGQFVLSHSNKDKVREAVKQSAVHLLKTKKVTLDKGIDDQDNFPLGSIVLYKSDIDDKTYLMLAMTELNKDYEAHTNLTQFESMLFRMWKEIDRVYASHNVVLPLLGTGISRFDDGKKDKVNLLRCMLCTLKNSGVTLNTNVSILISKDKNEDMSLYEFKDIFRSISRK